MKPPLSDPFFGGPSPLTPHCALARKIPGDDEKALLKKFGILRASVLGIRARLFPQREPALRLVNQALVEALTGDAMSPLGDSTMRSLVEQFQELVPFVPPAKLVALTLPGESLAELLSKKIEQFDEGSFGGDELATLTKNLGCEVDLPTLLASPRVHATKLLDSLDHSRGSLSQWVIRGAGSESRVYTAANAMVYKVAPIHEMLLDIPSLGEEAELGVGSLVYPLAGPLGSCPILDRLMHMASIPGMAMADLVGLTREGKVIFKQVDLGDQSPEMGRIAGWARDHACAVVDVDLSQVESESDAALLPLVTLCGKNPVLMLDANPRNCRIHDGAVVPFDLVSRELRAHEMKANPRIAGAVGKLRGKSTARRKRGT
jgi:hypothetical protein